MYIARAALQNETFCEIAFSTSHEIPATNLHEARTLHTTNYLVSEDLSYKYYYSKAAGVKTGYTSKAGRCLITTAQEDGLYLLSIVTGCESTEEMNGEIYMHSFPESKRLLEYGMSNFVHLTALSPLVPVGEAAVSGSDQSSVVVVPVAESAVTLPAGYAPQDITTEIQVNGGTLQAPVTAGDIVGTVTVYYRGVQMASTEITTIQDVSTGTSAAQQLASGEQSDVPQSRFSMWTVVLIVAILLVAAYLGLYTYRNLQRRKRKSKKRRTAKRK